MVVSVLLALQDPRTGLEVLAVAISVGQVVDQVIQPRLIGSIVGLQPAWLLISLPIGARLGGLLGLGDLLGLLLGGASGDCTKTFLDAWALRFRPKGHGSSAFPRAVQGSAGAGIMPRRVSSPSPAPRSHRGSVRRWGPAAQGPRGLRGW